MAGWRETLERNWPYMLTATLLSVLLWVSVSAEKFSQQTIPTDLVIINNDRRYVLTDREPASDVVSVTFTGQAGDLVSLSVQRPRIFVPIDSVQSLVWELELTPDMVMGRGGRELVDVRAVNVRPERLRLRFQPRAQKVVPVVPNVQVTLADGFVMFDSLHVEPSAVAVEGPEDAVAQIDKVLTVPVVRERVRESVALEVPLERPGHDELVSLSLSSVRISVSVEPKAERSFPGVPLSVVGVGVGDFRVEPPLVDVRLVGPRSAVASVRPEALLPWIELASPADVGRPLPIRLDAPSAFVEFTIVPDSARVVTTSDEAQ